MKETHMNLTKFFRTAIAISALFVGVAQTAKADIVTWTGDTTGHATVDLTPLGADASAVPYDALSFTVSESGDYTFLLTAVYNIDSVIVLYENSFDPNDAFTNSIAAGDDDVSLNTSSTWASLTAGTHYTLLVAGFADTDFGAYSVTVGGPGLISAVPEPSTWLMLGLGLAAVGYTARRKSLQ
jgi:hypothetical protein